MLKKVIIIIMLFLFSVLSWIFAEVISPGMVLVDEKHWAVTMYELNAVVQYIKIFSITLLFSGLAIIFIEEKIVFTFISSSTLVLTCFLINRFFILW